ncbi:MAG: cation:proton antiporter [Ilumatobacteraceae bacterium]
MAWEPARAFRSVGVAAGLLATAGVAVTAAIVAGVSWWLLELDHTTALLLGSVVASTDAAAVFAALRAERLPTRVRRMLQLESGLNDPVAVLLTIGMLELWRGDPTASDWARFLFVQLAAGAAVGVATGRCGRWIVDHVHGAAASSLGVLTLAIAALSYGLATAVGGRVSSPCT